MIDYPANLLRIFRGKRGMKRTICELFAGVGGFRLGFERQSKAWKTVWFSQWEPGARTQWAHDCYAAHFGDPDPETTATDIAEVCRRLKKDPELVPDHNLLVGGFPCQDYSVARSLQGAQGIEGKKGVLWWSIRDMLIAKGAPFGLFENVDRLLKSPASQRGRDFGVILACLNSLGYSAEWRVVNAADYGACQRRRRTFIFAWKNATKFGKRSAKLEIEPRLRKDGFFAKAFPVKALGEITAAELQKEIGDVSDSFAFAFENSGFMTGGKVWTAKCEPKTTAPVPLADILDRNVDEKYYIDDEKTLAKWKYLKGAKKIERTSKDGHKYVFSEGPIAFPDPIDLPARTMLTSESSLNRSSHIIRDPETGRMRIITPNEADRIQGFVKPGHTGSWTDKHLKDREPMPEKMRYFCMGNALVVPMITRMAKVLDGIFAAE